MKKVSSQQANKNTILSELKKDKPKVCVICGKFGDDHAHLLPKSIFPEHYLEPKNLVIMCRTCHNLFDNDLSFRQKQTKLFEQICEFDKQGAIRYFRFYE